MADTLYDVVIIGSGPAGIQAAIHASRKKIRVLLLGRIENSALYGAHVENYAFVPGVTCGNDLLETGLKQATSFGAEYLQEDVLKIMENTPYFLVTTESGRTIQSRAILFCMGVAKNKLGVSGERKFIGKGVSYCVDCDANFYRGATVAVTGGKSAAVDGALTLLDYAEKVYLISDNIDVSKELMAKLKESKAEVINSRIIEIQGENTVQRLELANGETVETEGIFIELGAKGALELATQVGVMLDTESFKYIQTDGSQQTNISGIFAAGDITGPPYQMAKAVGEGCVAGMEAANYAKTQKRQEKNE
ncbi:MAG: thioredoxin reductase [Desulfobulbus propionicus]|nr:MAG: thioredoxin reductase [Desulfobulbus propionicus]